MGKTDLYIIMGVSGTGKTTIGKLLSKALNLPFFDGDDFHPEANIIKMTSGKPLDDDDRQGWLMALNKLLRSKMETGAIVACSALKEKYRQVLREGLEDHIRFIFLQGSMEEIRSRLELRKGHFMPMALLKSQFDTLESPTDAITVSIAQTPDQIIQNILKQR